MESAVYFIDLRATFKESFVSKLARLVETAGLSEVVKPRDLVAVKVHFGERGNTAFIRPVFVRPVVDAVKRFKGRPFLTDANTLYAGARSDAAGHLVTAIENGFAFPVVNAPLVIADGLRGKSEKVVSVNRKHFREVYIAAEIDQADVLISLAHFKGHELAGFGGTLKNVGMGCASRRGKLAQHSSLSPKVKRKKCTGCGECVARCVQSAISLVKEKAVISTKACIGCGECILVCPVGAIQIQWNRSIPVFLENMVEYTLGVLQKKEGKALFVNFITDVSPACDCVPFNDAPIIRDIGVVASRDPVAVDQVSVDLVNREPGLPESCLSTHTGPGEDKFRGIYPKVDWEIQLDYAEAVGLGTRRYRLERI
ncbi:MAG: DUF362 domain-containing protein [Deltaproteobacteria bacterium]|nr:DUF362 domain-containing protein [Deltaproteobacteria bacterium]